jgi:spore coat protein U-like protein
MKMNAQFVRTCLRLTGIPVFVMSSLPAFAQLSGTLGVQLELSQSCNLVGSANTAGVNLGTLDFGTAPSTFTGQLTAQAEDGEGTPGPSELVCSPDIDGITVVIDGGLNAGEGAALGTGSRALSNGTDYIPYEVFSDSGHTTPYGIGAPGTALSIPSDGSGFALPIYGLINKTSNVGVTSGTYQDTLIVTITW